MALALAVETALALAVLGLVAVAAAAVAAGSVLSPPRSGMCSSQSRHCTNLTPS